MKHVLLTIGILCLWIGSAQAATLFDTDFEDCGTSGTSADFTCGPGWRYVDGGTATNMGIVTGNAFSGTKSLRLTFVTLDNTHSVTPTPSIYQPNPFAPMTHIFLRFAHFMNAGFQLASTGSTKLIRLQSNITGAYPKVWLMYHTGTYGFCMEGPYDYVGTTECMNSGVVPSKGTWQQIEVEWQLNTPGQANGLIRMWIDGTLRIERLNRAWIGPTLTSRGPSHRLLDPSNYTVDGAQVYLQSGVGTMYYDRIAVGTTRIGLVNGGPPPPPQDTTPPSPPTCAQIGTPCP